MSEARVSERERLRVDSVPGLCLRQAEPGDVPTVLRFIEGLAAYERLEAEAVATEADIARYLFGPDKVIDVVIADYDTEPAGFALYFFSFSTFLGKPGIYLEDLFVRPEHRGRGIGKALLVYLAKVALEKGCGRLEWSVLDWNEPAIGFYRQLGALAMDEWTVNRVTGEALTDLAGAVRLEAG